MITTKGTVVHYTCSQKKKTGCEGKATVQRIQSKGDDGNIVTEEKLVAVSSPAVHSRFHYPDQPAITADCLVFKMKEEVTRNPLAPVGMNTEQTGRVNMLFIFVKHRSGQRQDFERRAP